MIPGRPCGRNTCDAEAPLSVQGIVWEDLSRGVTLVDGKAHQGVFSGRAESKGFLLLLDVLNLPAAGGAVLSPPSYERSVGVAVRWRV